MTYREPAEQEENFCDLPPPPPSYREFFMKLFTIPILILAACCLVFTIAYSIVYYNKNTPDKGCVDELVTFSCSHKDQEMTTDLHGARFCKCIRSEKSK